MRRYKPYGAAKDVILSTEPSILYDSPRGCGKTVASTHKAFMCAVKYPNSRILLCRETRAAMTDSVLVSLEEHALTPTHYTLKNGPSRATRRSYVFNNGSEIIVASLEHIDRLRSAEYDLIIVYEATHGVSRDDYDVLTACLDRRRKMPFNQILLECNPSYPTHWIMKSVHKGDIKRYQGRFTDNPSITPEFINRLEQYRGFRRERDYLGNWVAAEGLVYPDMNQCIHEFDINKLEGEDWGGLDWGWRDPFVALVGRRVIDDDGDNFYIWYERYKTETLLKHHIAAIPDALYWADPSSPDLISEMISAGKSVYKAYTNDIELGIQAVQNRIYRGTLHIHPSCKALIAEATMYIWDEKKMDKPIDKFNHAMDALRYLIVSCDRRIIGS